MSLKTVAAIAAMGVALSGCATIIEGTTQSISVSTNPPAGAQCTLASALGTWYVTTPGSVTVHKSKTDITAICKKDGYQDATQIIPSTFQATTAGNILLGGIVGIGVDAASGADYKYPALSVITMVPIGQTAPAPTSTPAPKAAPQTTPADPKAPTKSTS